jgi:hypothetical protein
VKLGVILEVADIVFLTRYQCQMLSKGLGCAQNKATALALCKTEFKLNKKL